MHVLVWNTLNTVKPNLGSNRTTLSLMYEVLVLELCRGTICAIIKNNPECTHMKWMDADWDNT